MIFHNGSVASVIVGDCLQSLRGLPDATVNCCVTSPPYFGLRDYGHEGQIGLEETPDQYVARLVEVFREVRRVLTDDGTLWLNIGDSYAGSWGNQGRKAERGTQRPIKGEMMQPVLDGRYPSTGSKTGSLERTPGCKNKDLIGIPWMLAFALRADGWYLRQEIIWHKPNPMPESVTDRCTKAHEQVFLLSKSPRYYYDSEAVKEPAVSEKPAGNRTHKYADAYNSSDSEEHRTKAGLVALAGVEWKTRNRRSVWTVAPRPYAGAHFAVYPPELITPCILAGCPPAGKRCDCDEIVDTPTGSGESVDPSLTIGRAGMSRPRRDGEGTRPITRRQQRHHASEMKASPYRAAIESLCGTAFAHYIRTDRAGARPLPPDIADMLYGLGWITDAPPCDCPIHPAGVVLDPFGGSGTTAGVALAHGRNALLLELNPEYAALMPDRVRYITGAAA
jgi:DNA modification methylase